MIIPVRFKKMFEGGAEAGITNVLHVNAEYMKDFRSHEVIAAVCEKYDLKIVFCDKRPKVGPLRTSIPRSWPSTSSRSPSTCSRRYAAAAHPRTAHTRTDARATCCECLTY